MNVLKDLLEWSQERPAWQQDALRRLVVNGDLSDDDIHALTDICKSAHGLANQQTVVPLAAEHVPDKAAGAAPVSLVSIFHHRGVNALAEGQTLKFGPNLTVVYGDNAAGKSGYIRILKSACRARGQEKILDNVVSGAAPLSLVVAIKYKVGTEPDPREWAGNGEDDFISRVSVFDTQCAAVYLTEKTDVAFRPFGLDLFDKLVKACKAVRGKLEAEQRALASDEAVVSQKLKQSFQDELAHLSFRHVEVELKEVGGAEGVLYHKLILMRAPGVELPKVVSEGEQRCLSIAAFFAELSTADDPSSIVFDDPVSSLDYKWCEGVAKRLVEEAKSRQVIVFTHDVVFLLRIKQYAEEQGVEQLDQHVRQLPKGAGVCAEELPWVALPVRKKVGYLKNEWQAAEKLLRDGHQANYEKKAKYLYGLLREAWERAVEKSSWAA